MEKFNSLFNKSILYCVNCGSERLKLFEHTVWRAIELNYCICEYCSLVFLNPVMDLANTNIFYANFYREIYNGSSKPTQHQIEYQHGRANHFAEIFKSLIEKTSFNVNPKFLDIGCSAGILLDKIKSLDNRIINYGIEPGNDYREFCKKNGHYVYKTINELENANLGKFELICMSHVLEHIVAPIEYLTYIREKIICDNGFMIIEVPNFFGHPSYEIAHNICFTFKTLKDTIYSAGFQLVGYKIHAKPNSTRKPLYLTFIISPTVNNFKIKKYLSWKVKLMRKTSNIFYYNYYQLFYNFLSVFKK